MPAWPDLGLETTDHEPAEERSNIQRGQSARWPVRLVGIGQVANLVTIVNAIGFRTKVAVGSLLLIAALGALTGRHMRAVRRACADGSAIDS